MLAHEWKVAFDLQERKKTSAPRFDVATAVPISAANGMIY